MATDFTSQITAWYQAVQYRTPPAADLAVYNASLQSGALTIAQVQTSITNDLYTQNIVNPVIREYQAAFGRVPDQAGAAYWTGVVAANPTVGLAQLGTTFANSLEFNARFGATATTIATPSVVTALYTNVLGRAPDAAGLAFWQASGLTAAQLLNAFAGSAEFVTATAPGVTAFQQLEIAGTPPTTGSLFAIATGANGTTFTLTLNQDVLVGTALNDTFNAPILQDNAGNNGQSLQSFDSLDGGNGVDILNASITGAGAIVVAPTLKSIETINVRATGNNILSLANATGVVTVTADSSTATSNVTGVGGAAIGVTNTTQNANFDGLTAATTALNLANDGKTGARIVVDLASATASKATGIAVTTNNAFVTLAETKASAAVNSLTVSTSGTNPAKGFANELQVSAADSATIKTLTVSGTASVDLSATALSALTGVTAGDGGVKLVSTNNVAGALTVTAGAGADDVTVTGVSVKSLSVGAGNDKVTTTGDAALNLAAANAQNTLNNANGVVQNDQVQLNILKTIQTNAQTALTNANNTVTADNADIVVKTATKNAAQTTLNTDTATQTQAQTAKNGIDAIVTADQTAQTNAQNAVNADNAAVTAATTAKNTATTNVTTATATKAAADAAVVADNANVTAKTTAKATADAIVTATTTMTTGIQAVNTGAKATDVTAEQAFTAAAVTAGAITDAQRVNIDNAFFAGRQVDLATALAQAANAYSGVVTANNTAATNAATALTNATNTLNTDLATQTAAATALTNANTALTNANTTLTNAQATQAADTAILNTANTKLATDQATQTAAGNTLTAANLLVTNDTTALNTANTALTTAQTKLATDTGTANAAQTTLTTANTNVTNGQNQLTADQALQVIAANASTAANTAAAVAGALSATSTTDLGTGDNTLTLSNGFAEGATITAGAGTNDKIIFKGADYLVASGYAAANLAKVSGFETLGFNDAAGLGGGNYDISKLAGITAVSLDTGVATGNFANLTNATSGVTVTLTGDLVNNNGQLGVALKTDGTADVLNLVLKANYADNNDTVATVNNRAEFVISTGFETVNVNSSGNQTAAAFTPVAGYKADTVTNTLNLIDVDLTTLKVTGDQALVFASAANMTKLATVDASANTGGLTFDGSLATNKAAALTVTGSATAANAIIGTQNADTIVGGSKADVITGGGGADTLTGGAGNDIFKYVNFTDSTIAARDTVTDFTANTVGVGAGGAATAAGAAAANARNGDVIDISAFFGGPIGHNVDLFVAANAANAQTYIQNAFAGGTLNNSMHAALDSSTGILYVDANNDGNIDLAIGLTGVTTLTTAAFIV